MKSLLLTLLLVPSQIMAQQAVEKTSAVDPISSSYMIKLTAGLVLVVGLVFFLAWLVKKTQLVQGSNVGLIKIVSAVSVGQRERIALIQVGEEQILVGLTPGKINKLHKMEKPVMAESLPSTTHHPFQKKFQQLINKGKSDEME